MHVYDMMEFLRKNRIFAKPWKETPDIAAALIEATI